MAEHADEPAREEIAVVGMAGRFPGAADIHELWAVLRSGESTIRAFDAAELTASGVGSDTLADPYFVNAGAVMDDADGFDADFFGMTPREAELTDPQHRVFLECVWEALEHAAYDPATFDGRIAVYGGVGPNTYFSQNVSTDRERMRRAGSYPLLIASEREYAVTRAAFKLGLTGPAVNVSTACSTSAVAVHLACQSLLGGDSDLAVAGGVRIRVPLTAGYVYEEGGILSPDGLCRAFDADARGTVAASGGAFVVLKRLSDAVAARDTVYALVKGTAINNDGSDKVGFTAPSVGGQAAVVADALAMAEVSADDIDYVEAHGTGTSIGDPIEVAALTRAFRRDTDRAGYCRIGSVKTNIGHLDAAAGVAGLIKTVLALRAGALPASLNFRRANPELDLDRSPFVVNDRLTDWPEGEKPRRAGVSSFGLGGTNAHLVVEEAPPTTRSADTGEEIPHQLVVVSARTGPALQRGAERLADFLSQRPDLEIADVAHSLQVGRRHFPHRRAVVARSGTDAAAALRAATSELPAPSVAQARVAYLFPGGGSQHPDMARGLYDRERTFRDAFDECADGVRALTGHDLRTVLFPVRDDSRDGSRDNAVDLSRPGLGLPALFAVELSLARWWISRGVRPAAMIGHSAGEYAAACIAGVFSLDDALRVVCTRSALMEAAPPGVMLSVALPSDEVGTYLSENVTLAVVNTPDSCVLAGRPADIDVVEQRLEIDGVDASRVRIAVASHSPLMDPVLGELAACLRTVSLRSPTVPFVSNVTGTWIEEAEATDPGYWVRHLRSTVQFSAGLSHLLAASDVQVEMGPGQTLSSLVRAHPGRLAHHRTTPSMRRADQEDDDVGVLVGTVGSAWAAGVEVDFAALADGRESMRVGLPTYPFEHQRFWIDPVGPDRNGSAGRARDDEVQTTAVTASAPGPVSDRRDRVAAQLVEILCELSGRRPEDLDRSTPFADLGFDSLFLTQANTAFRKSFGVKITFRQLFEQAPTVASLAEFIDQRLAPEALPPPSPEPVVAPPADDVAARSDRPESSPAGGAPSDLVDRILSEQLKIMSAQLELLRGSPAAAPDGPDPSAVATTTDPLPRLSASGAVAAGGPGSAARRPSAGDVDDRQRAAIDELVRRYGAMTGRSRELAQQWRPKLADNRTIVGFDPLWKDLVYQIVSARSAGPRIWDVDGNEYVDTALCFGAVLLGHSPDFLVRAVEQRLREGFAVGVQSHQLGAVTEQILDMSGNERLTYCHSGGEAVETAIRIARTVTARDKVAYFTDDIHGRSDIVLGRAVGSGQAARTVPLVAGVPQHVVDDALVLDYGSPDALEVIQSRASELAAVLVEPVRTRNPDLQPVQFLRDLRDLADRAGFLLIFDEVVTGFRVHQRGVQGLWDVRADLSTYGKVLGGGMPIGVVAGASELVDVIDGGQWRFGDDSYPSADITGSGGTMIKHPVSLAAAGALLDHLAATGPVLQETLTATTVALVASINDYYQARGIAIHVQQFGSFFRPTMTDNRRFEGLFQYFLRERGVHLNPPSPSFLSCAHGDEEVALVARAYQEAGTAMARAGLLEQTRARPASGSGSGGLTSPVVTEIPVLPNAARFLEERSSPELHHWNVGGLLEAVEPLDERALRAAVAEVIRRHDALRLRYVQGADGSWRALVQEHSEAVPFSTLNLSTRDDDEQPFALQHAIDEAQSGFDLATGPLIRVVHVDLGARGHRLLVVMHHLVMDGLSWRPFWDDFLAAYEQSCKGEPLELPPSSSSFTEWAMALERYAGSDEAASDLHRWLDLPWRDVRPVPLDRDDPRLGNTNASARQVTLALTRSETEHFLHGTPAVRQKIDLLISALAEALGDWTASDTVLLDLMGHGRDEDLFEDVDLFATIGFFISYTPIVLRTQPHRGAGRLLTDQIHRNLRHGLSFDLLRTLSSERHIRDALQALPRAQVLFNYLGKRSRLDTVPDTALFRPALESAGPTHSPNGMRYYPLSVSAEIWDHCLRLAFVYSENFHDRVTVENLVDRFHRALSELVEISSGTSPTTDVDA